MGVMRAADGVSGERAGASSGVTQTDAVLEFLRSRGPLTQPMAQEELGCLRLGARIWDLKQRGFSIATELVELPSGQRVAEYSLSASGRGASGSSTRLKGEGGSERSPVLPGDGGGGSESSSETGGDLDGAGGGELVGSGVGLRDGVTLDDALVVFGDLVMELGVSPTVREFGGALGVSSESVAFRWVRVLEREGLLAPNSQFEQGVAVGSEGGRLAAGAEVGGRLAAGTDGGGRLAAGGWAVTAAGFERLYGIERGRRVELEGGALLEGGVGAA